MSRGTLKTSVVTLIVAALVAALGVGAFVLSGIYDIAASTPHGRLEVWLITLLKRRSVENAAEDVQPPPLDDPDMVRRGFVLYRDLCVSCHGAPGETRSRIGTGLNPTAPPLSRSAVDWSTGEIYWIIANGLKMAGMPAFELGEEPEDLWALTAFVVRMNTLSPAEYRRMADTVDGRLPPGEDVAWLPSEGGWAELEERGDARRGREAFVEHGCGACHVVPDLPGAEGLVGPPLGGWSARHYIAGRLVNRPDALVRWILDPPTVDPVTAMPDLGLSEQEAWDVAAFLYTLDDPEG